MVGVCDTADVGNDHWPLLDLEVHTPRLALRYLDDALQRDVLAVARRGVHDPTTMPFMVPWTDLPSPQLEQEAMRFYARNRADLRPDAWNLQFAVLVDGEISGSCDLGAENFVTLRQFRTGSWLGRQFQGGGLGKEMRMACLALGFDGLHSAFATTAAWHDNAASLGVTRSLGYSEQGRRRELRRGVPDELVEFRMSREHWETIRRDDIELHGVPAARSFLQL